MNSMNPIELLMAAWSYGCLRRNVGRASRVIGAAAAVYAASYDTQVMARLRRGVKR